MKLTPQIEPLEARIAPAAVIHFTDVDGDLVTVALSQGTLAQLTYDTANASPGAFGNQFLMLDLQGNHAFDGANIIVTAKPQLIGGVLRGDGHVDLGFIDATGIPLGAVTVPGDLGKLVTGGSAAPFGVKTLTLGSLGARGTETGAPDLQTTIDGRLGTAKIAGDLKGYLYSGLGIGSVSVGGDIVGSAVDYLGGIYTQGDVGSVTVKGNVVGSDGILSGIIGAGHKMGNVTIGGSLLGGAGTDSGKIFSGYIAASDMGVIKIGRDVVGGKTSGAKVGTDAGAIYSTGAITSVTIGGSMRGNTGTGSGRIQATGDIGAVLIVGSVLGESGGASGGTISAGHIASVKIVGSVIGGDASFSGGVFANVTTLSIGGDLAGGLGSDSGRISGIGFGTVAIGGSIRGANDPDPSDGQLVADSSGTIKSSSSITKLTIGGSLEGSNAVKAGSIEVTGLLGSLTVGGDLRGGSGGISASISAGNIGTAAIHGSIIGGVGTQSGYIGGFNGIAKITVGGSVTGGNLATLSGVIRAQNGMLGGVTIGGDLVGSDGLSYSGLAPHDSGAILAKRIGSVTIGGSIFSGAAGTTPTQHSGAIVADEDIGAIAVKGSLVGNAGEPVEIYATGLAGAAAEKDVAIKSITIGGRVEETLIFAGGESNDTNANGNAQIGTVKVGGAWIASLMVNGAKRGAGIGEYADGSALAVTPGGKAKVGSIVIGGPVLGRAGSNVTFGFVSREIGSFKYQGIALALTAGAGNDTFGSGKAQVLGPSLSTHNTDGFAVHVFEV